MKYMLCVLGLILLFSCKSNNDLPVTKTGIYTDTIVTVDSLNFSEAYSKKIEPIEDYAREVLLAHFAKRGYFDEAKISFDSLLATNIEDDKMPECIMYDTLYKVNLNKDMATDGIITYWQAPCKATGNNYRPHKAMITTIKGKFTIINAEFIPDYFIIDSVTQEAKQTFIYVKEFDRSSRECVRNYRIRIIDNLAEAARH